MGSSMSASRLDVSNVAGDDMGVFLGQRFPLQTTITSTDNRAHIHRPCHTNTGLFKQQGRVYFETMWKGGVYKFFIPDSELPMISGMYTWRGAR